MFAYNIEKLRPLIGSIIQENVSPEAWGWLASETTAVLQNSDIKKFSVVFVSIPRKTGKKTISLSETQLKEIKLIRRDLLLDNWTADRLCRVWLILHLNPTDQTSYFNAIENLFKNAEMNELVALYSALPLLAYPEAWQKRCSEGIRSNIALVLEAIMCNNPYPSEQLQEAAWNQLVLKAIFTEKPIHKIIGLQERSNPSLVHSLVDFANERWAAHRTVPPLVWKCVGKFINEYVFSAIKRVASSENYIERECAILACSESDYTPAKELLQQHAELKKAVERGELSWQTVAQQVEVVSL